MWWMKKTMATTCFGDGGTLGYVLLPKTNLSSAASPTDPSASGNSSTEATAVVTVPAIDDVPEVKLRELKKATRSFSDKTLIGEGRSGKVYMASLRGGMTVAAKMLRPPPPLLERASDATFLAHQVSVASRLRHKNLVRLLGYNITGDGANLRVVLLYEFADLGNLHEALHGGTTARRSRPTTLSWEQRVRIALDAARGLAYLHEAGVTHHDVQSTNVLLFPGLRAKIADYDMFKQLPSEDVQSDYSITLHDIKCAAIEYWPPEFVLHGHVTQMGDVFSFGVVLLELLTGIMPSDSEKIKSAVDYRVIPLMDQKLGKQYHRAGARKLARIALQCLHKKPTSRPSMAAIVREIQDGVVACGKGCISGSGHGGMLEPGRTPPNQ